MKARIEAKRQAPAIAARGMLLGAVIVGLGGCVNESAIGWSARVQADAAGVCAGDPIGQALYASSSAPSDDRVIAFVDDDGEFSLAVVEE